MCEKDKNTDESFYFIAYVWLF